MRAITTYLAQVEDIQGSSDGLPGANFIKKVLGWTMQLALWGSVGSLLGGAGLWGLGQLSGNAQGAARGKNLALAGAAGAVIAGLAVALVNGLFTQAKAGA